MRDREAFVHVNGVGLWTATRGEGDPVLLVHGGPGICDYLAPVADMLDDMAAVHRYEQRGCGRSPEVEPIDIDTLVSDIEGLRDAWGHERWSLVGHSWGAALSLMYAIAHPRRVTKLAYVSGTGITNDWVTEYRANRAGRLTEDESARWDEVRRRVGSGEGGPELEVEWAELLVKTDFADASRLSLAPRPFFAYPVNRPLSERLGAEWDELIDSGVLPDQLRALATPTLVVHGADDPRPSRPAREVAALIPNAQFVLLEDVGHEPFWERPEPLRDELRGFLA